MTDMPFGVAGEHAEVLENILNEAIKVFVDKYRSSANIRQQDFDVLAYSGRLEHSGYLHPVHVFKVMQLKAIPTKTSKTSMYRIYTPPHILFTVKDITKIDLGNFLYQFTFFEAVTLHLLSLTEANNLNQYISLQHHYAKISLHDRLSIIADNYTKRGDSSSVKYLRSNILHVRNQIAHSLAPINIIYKGADYDTNSSLLIHDIKNNMEKAMCALADVYMASQQKLVRWLNPDSQLDYTQALSDMRAKK